MHPIKSIAFVVNINKEGAETLAHSLGKIVENRGGQTRTISSYPLPYDFLRGIDFCCVIGGDGTLLGVVPEAVRNRVPVLGINLGKLGFLATFTAFEAEKKFASLLEGNFRVVERSLITSRNSAGKTALALNDVVIKNYSAGLVSLHVYSDGQFVNAYNCDGLVFSTPTGSTAYNLSAGGPLIHPEARVIALTPICPHTLSHRSVIFDYRTDIEVVLREPIDTVHISIDGNESFDWSANFPLHISLADQTFLLVQHTDYIHFQLVRSKLQWGNGNHP